MNKELLEEAKNYPTAGTAYLIACIMDRLYGIGALTELRKIRARFEYGEKE